jgi:putative ABC transport system ATP-binding protein
MSNDVSTRDRPLLELRGLCASYREGTGVRRVLSDLDLQVRAGECIALLGRSGSGKSTLLNLISGIDRPASGEVVIDGRNLTRMNERARTLFRRRHIGFVYQAFNLLPTLTVAENLLLPLDLNHLDGARSGILLEEIGLGGRHADFPDRLSGGEQQRVAIARALVHQPLLVLADEPTGNLDAETGRHTLGLLDRLVRQTGRTLLIATHSREVAAIADRILVLVDGRLARGSLENAW